MLAAGALERGAADGAEGIELDGRSVLPAELPRKLPELAPENPGEPPPRLSPAFSAAFPPPFIPLFIRENVIGAGLRGIEGAEGMAFTARRFSRIGMVAICEFTGIAAIPGRAGIVPVLTAVDARSAATLPTVGANILAGALAPRTL